MSAEPHRRSCGPGFDRSAAVLIDQFDARNEIRSAFAGDQTAAESRQVRLLDPAHPNLTDL